MSADLGGDDIKVVRYTIAFVKRGFETVLERGEEVVAHDSDASRFRAEVIADYLQNLSRDGRPWPPGWEQAPGEGYPVVGQVLRAIPADDEKYLEVSVDVLDRRPLSDSQVERARVEVLREVKDKLT